MKKFMALILVFGLVSISFSSSISAASSLNSNVDGDNLDDVINAIDETIKYAEKHNIESLNNPDSVLYNNETDSSIHPTAGLLDAYMKGRYGEARAYIWIENFFMGPDNAYDFALNLQESAAESLFWLGASWLPGIGSYLALGGTLGNINLRETVNQITNLTQEGKSVQIIFMFPGVGSGGSGYLVREWDTNSYPVYKGQVPSYYSETYRQYKF